MDDKSSLIQFRIDTQSNKELKRLADELQTPPGVLARLWVMERLRLEQAKYRQSQQDWRQERLQIIKRDYAERGGPIAAVHFFPSDNMNIPAAELQSRLVSLSPLSGSSYSTRINFDGLRSETAGARAYFQFFTSGQIEWVRSLQPSPKIVMGGALDAEIVDACVTAYIALHGLQHSWPIAVGVSLLACKGYAFGAMRVPIEEADVIPKPVTAFKRPADLSSMDVKSFVALTIKPALDSIWNAAGFSTSQSFDGSKWLINR